MRQAGSSAGVPLPVAPVVPGSPQVGVPPASGPHLGIPPGLARMQGSDMLPAAGSVAHATRPAFASAPGMPTAHNQAVPAGTPPAIGALLTEAPVVLKRVSQERMRAEASRVVESRRLMRWRRLRSLDRFREFHPLVQLLGCLSALALTAGCVTLLLVGYDAAMAEVSQSRMKRAPPVVIEPALAEQLGEEIVIRRFGIRIPRSMVERNVDSSLAAPGVEARAFAGSGPSGNSAIIISVQRLPRRLRNNELQTFLNEQVALVNKRGTRIQLQNREGERLINGLAAVRGTCILGTGVNVLYGTYVMAHDGTWVVFVVGLSSEQPGTATHRLLNASLSTLRKA